MGVPEQEALQASVLQALLSTVLPGGGIGLEEGARGCGGARVHKEGPLRDPSLPGTPIYTWSGGPASYLQVIG